nr:uncharacterized mitochondrial protein AtMg00810-like [Tanacetum cinerariifolium]
MHKAFPLPEEVPTASEESSHCQKKREATAVKIALLLKSRRNCLSKSDDSYTNKYKTTQELWAAILKTFGGNEATKKTKKNLLKQRYVSAKTLLVLSLLQSIGSQIKFKDVNQIDEDDMEEMDIKWNMALLSMRADRFWKKTGKKISIQGSDVAGFDKSKVECFNCHKMGYFARECRAPRSQDRRRRDNYRQGSKVEEHAPKALMEIDGVGWDWSYMANDEENHALVADKEAPTEFALLANTSAESKVFDNSLCSKDRKKNTDNLNSKITDLTDKLFDVKNMIYHYKLGLAQVKSRLPEHRDREIKYCEKIRRVEYKTELSNSLKDLDSLLESQRLDKNKEGLGYSAVPPPPAQIYSSPKKDISQNNIDDKGYWDSGCSRHMTGNISYLSDYEPFDGGYVSFGKGVCKITGKGTIKTGKLEFENVYFVKDLNEPQDDCCTDVPKSSGNCNPTVTSTNLSADQIETLTVETPIPTVSLLVPTACFTDSQEPSSDTRLISKRVANQVETPSLDNSLTLTSRFEYILGVTTNSDESDGVEADVSKIETTITSSPTPTLRIHKDHPKSQIIGPVDTPIQTRNKSKEDPEFPAKVYKVEKAMYGLHQAPRAWYGTLSKYLLTNGFQRVTINQTLFIRRQRGDFILVQVYLDNIIFGSSNPHLCREIEALMHEKFQISAMGELNFFLGLQVLKKEDGIFLSQKKYVRDILKKFRYLDVRSSNTPIDKENPWGKDKTRKDVDLHLYRSMIGSLMYLTASRPDIMFVVCACARHQVTPKECHLHAVKRIFRYLKGYPKLGLWYPKECPFDLVAYSNSDYGGATQDCKSTTRGCQFLGRRIETTKEGTKILATVDGILIIVTESSLRRNLKLQDEEGISSLPDAKLFENLTLMGYNISPSQKFTFQKGQFSYQWKYLIHTVMQGISPKSTGFNEFSSNIATALV